MDKIKQALDIAERNAESVAETRRLSNIRHAVEDYERDNALIEAAKWAVEVWRGGPDKHDADEFNSAMGDLERALRS